MAEKPFWCFSEYHYFVIETSEDGTMVSVNTANYDVPDTFKDYFMFSTEQSKKLFLELKIQYGEKFPKFFEETEDIGEIRATDEREIIEATHELIHHLFSHEIKEWALIQYRSYDESYFNGI